MMSKLDLSVVILNHRNDDRLERCLKSVTFADEILVLDDKSDFNWSKYQQVTVKPIVCPIDDFGAVRNQGLEWAKHEWVLFLDSDEWLPESAAKKVAQALADVGFDGYWLPRHDFYAGKMLKYGETGHLYFLRLMRKKVAHWERKVHEIAAVAGQTTNLDVAINHEPHRSAQEFLSKVNHYAALQAQSRDLPSKTQWAIEAIFYPPGKFFYNYILKMGFRDNWRGIIYAYCMSIHSLLVRLYMYERYQTK